MSARSRYDDEEQPRYAPSHNPPAEEIETYDEPEAELDDEIEDEIGDEDEGYDDEVDPELEEEDEAPIQAAAPGPIVVAPARPAHKPTTPPRQPSVRQSQPRPAASGRPAQARSASQGRPTGQARPAASGSSRISRPAAGPQPTQNKYLVPAALSIGLIVVVVGLLWIFSLNQNQVAAPTVPEGEAVALVNNVPIFTREFDERVQRDKEIMMGDPLTAALLNNFEGITGTRALEVVRYDALDKLINLEVIRQEARKEGRWPSDETQRQLIETAKAQDLSGGESFNQFLTRLNISEEQYNNSVVTNIVYTVMAGEHMPKTGDGNEKTNGFISWMCNARKGYDVKILITFQNINNQPCTSGLPSDIPIAEMPIPGAEPTTGTEVGTPVIPEPELTVEVPQ